MKRHKFMLLRRYQLHEKLSDDILVFPHRRFHIGINYTLFRQLVPDIMVNHFGIILCSHACQGFLLRLRNPQTLKGILDVPGNLIPVTFHIRIWPDIGDDVVHMKLVQRRSPVRHRQPVINFQRTKAMLQHPFRLIFHF